MKNSDVERINVLLMENRWLLDSVNAILATIPDGRTKLAIADGFVLIIRGLIRTSARVQEIFLIKEPTPNPNDPRFIHAIEKLLQENMDWIKPLVERYKPVDVHDRSSIEEIFATAEECSSCDHY